MTQDKYYILEEGIEDPREGSLNWRAFDYYSNLTQAKKEAKDFRGPCRIVEAKVIWEGGR